MAFKKLSNKLAFTMFSLIFTSFVFLNTYEVIANQEVPFGVALFKISMQNVINYAIDDFKIKINSKVLNNNSRLDELESLTIPSLKIKIQLEEARRINESWYQRPSMIHYIGLNKDDYGNTVDYLLYTNKSWRTIDIPDDIEVGTEIMLRSQKGLEVPLKVADKQILPLEKPFIADKSEGRQVLLLVEDQTSGRYYGYSLIINR